MEGKENKPTPTLITNVNIGILGHVDVGKTALAKALSTESSTAAFDKHPQAQERGITIDLGFSAFSFTQEDGTEVRCTLVDCPGHASLVKAVAGGFGIVDVVLLVVDATRGFQPQGSEALVLADMFEKPLVIALNKTDKLSANNSEGLEKAVKGTKRLLGMTHYYKDKEVPVVGCSAITRDVENVKEALKRMVKETISLLEKKREENKKKPLLLSYDHHFELKGRGWVFTGTVLSGEVKVGTQLCVSGVSGLAKVKSLQMFHKSVLNASSGDRVGVCLALEKGATTNRENNLGNVQTLREASERGVLYARGSMERSSIFQLIATPVPFYKHDLDSVYKLIVGHSSVPVKLTPIILGDSIPAEGLVVDELLTMSPPYDSSTVFVSLAKSVHQESLLFRPGDPFLLLDTQRKSECRLVLHGTIKCVEEGVYKIRQRKTKEKTGTVDRVDDSKGEAIVRGLLRREQPPDMHVGLCVVFESGATGVVTGSFGHTGRERVRVEFGIVRAGERCSLIIEKLEPCSLPH